MSHTRFQLISSGDVKEEKAQAASPRNPWNDLKQRWFGTADRFNSDREPLSMLSSDFDQAPFADKPPFEMNRTEVPFTSGEFSDTGRKEDFITSEKAPLAHSRSSWKAPLFPFCWSS